MAKSSDGPGYGNGFDALIRATVTVVAERGLRGMTFRAVAEKAGVRNSLITYHFGNREALLVAAVKWAVVESVERSLPLGRDSIDQEFVHELLALVRREPDLQTFHYEVLLESRRNPQLAPLARLLGDAYLEALERILRIRGHRNPRLLARMLHATFDGMVFHQLTMPDTEDAEGALTYFVEMLDRDLAFQRGARAERSGVS